MKKTNKIYIYDGTFEGLLTIVYKTLEEKQIPLNIIKGDNWKTNLFEIYEHIESDCNKSDKILKYILKKISNLSLYNAYNTFLSNKDDKEITILYYLINGFKFGSKIDTLRNLNCVIRVQKYCNSVKKEVHRLKGFLRFKTIKGNILYSEFEPDNDILELIVPHFKKRLKNEKWAIIDIKRKKGAFYNGSELKILDTSNFDLNNVVNDLDENNYQDLWKRFISSVNINERKNLRCQVNFMPKRYWKYMSEVKNE